MILTCLSALNTWMGVGGNGWKWIGVGASGWERGLA